MNTAIQPVHVNRTEKPISRARQPSPNRVKGIACRVLQAAEYPEWDDLADRSAHGTIFHSSWWLQATGADFVILGIRDERGGLVAGMPVPFERRHGLKLVRSPAFTPYLGPVFELSTFDRECDRLHFMRSHGEILAQSVQTFDCFRCAASGDVPDWLGFLWAGFEARLAYTFRFPASRTLAQVLANMSEPHRVELRRALRMDLDVNRDGGIEDLLSLNHKGSNRKSAESALTDGRLRHLWNAARARGRARIYIARTSDNTPIAGLFAVLDQRRTYHLLSVVDPELRAIPGLNLMFWNALQDCIFAGTDFELAAGYGAGVTSLYERWGAMSAPIWRLEKAGSWRGKLLHSLADHRESRLA